MVRNMKIDEAAYLLCLETLQAHIEAKNERERRLAEYEKAEEEYQESYKAEHKRLSECAADNKTITKEINDGFTKLHEEKAKVADFYRKKQYSLYEGVQDRANAYHLSCRAFFSACKKLNEQSSNAGEDEN